MVKATAAHAVNASNAQSVSVSTWLLLVYVWLLTTTPHIRFGMIADTHFERILVVLIVLSLLSGQKIIRSLNLTTVILIGFFLWSLVSYLQSPYQDAGPAVWWIGNYWKLMLFYFFLVLGIRNLRDLEVFIIGVALISFGYQLLSWRDFLAGGSYVYQQGGRRMIGTWSGGGIGAANAYGLLALYSLPFAQFWLTLTRRAEIKWLALFFMVVCFASIIFSGSRAAMVCGLLFFLVGYGRKLLSVKLVLALAVGGAIALSVMPDHLRHRYFDLIFVNPDAVSRQGADRIAQESAQSRIQGLHDGFSLALQRPVFGYGPGSSALARAEVQDTNIAVIADDPEALQLHNLYGQVLAETGFAGALFYVALLAATLLQLTKMRHVRLATAENTAVVNAAARTLITTIVLLLIFGMTAHSLYRYYWLVLFALHVVLIDIVFDDRYRSRRP
jgi:O-antigen ligase